jgi:hypothetical protein
MATAIMHQASRRSAAALPVQRVAANLADYLALAQRVQSANQNLSRLSRIAQAARPFAGLLGRAVPLVGAGLILYDAYRLALWARSATWVMRGWAQKTWCGTPEVLSGVADGITDTNCGVGRVYFTRAAWAAGLNSPQVIAGQYQLRGYSSVRDPDYTFPTLASAVRRAQFEKPVSAGPASPFPGQLQTWVPASWGQSAPMIWGIDPASMPIQAIGGPPVPPPMSVSSARRVNPWRSWQYQYYADNGSSFRRQPAHDPGALERLAPVMEIGVASVDVDASGYPQAHPLARPARRNVRERKLRARGARIIIPILSTLTESADAINAVFAALPAKYRQGLPKKYLERAKLKILFEHWSEIDPVLAVENLVWNQIEDYVIGQIGKRVKRASAASKPHGNLPVGYAFGPAL